MGCTIRFLRACERVEHIQVEYNALLRRLPNFSGEPITSLIRTSFLFKTETFSGAWSQFGHHLCCWHGGWYRGYL